MKKPLALDEELLDESTSSDQLRDIRELLVDALKVIKRQVIPVVHPAIHLPVRGQVDFTNHAMQQGFQLSHQQQAQCQQP